MQVLGASIAACRRRRLGLAVGLAFALLLVVLPTGSAVASARAKGLDVSNWNGAIRWSKVRSAGYRFAFAKATEGTSYTDKTYTTNRNGSEAAGLVFGAYHFAQPSGGTVAAATASAIAQANRFLAVAGPQPGELPPVLDLEKTGNLPTSRLLVWTLAWLGQVTARTGVEPFIYTSPLFWRSHLGNSQAVAAAGTELWIAHWTSASQPWVPAQNWAGVGWRFWQWSDCVSVPGVPKKCTDGDRMNGANLTAVAIEPYPTGLPLLSTPPTVVGAPQAGQLLAALPGLWEGGKPLKFSYAWRRCDAAGAQCAPISGATALKYRPGSADVGHALAAAVTATSAAGSATAVTPPTAAVSPAGTPPTARPTNLSPPQIVGTAQAGQSLTGSVGTWTGSPKKFAYRWRRCDATGAACIAILHAIQSHYTLTPDDIGSTLSLVVTATGAGGATSATTAATGIVVAAPLPTVSIGTQTVRRGVAGNLQTTDGRASVTWQPGALRAGRTVSLDVFTGTLTLPGSEVSLTVPGVSRGFRWPLDIAYSQPQPERSVLGYSTDGRVYHSVPALQPAQLPPGTAVGWYVDSSNHLHVLTRTPLRLALFRKSAWGDPTYSSPTGAALATQVPLRVLPHRSDRSVLLVTRLAVHSQAKLSASVVGRGGGLVPILGKGSLLGPPLRAGTYSIAQVYRARPGVAAVRLRLRAATLRGSYKLRFVAFDPWGRRSVLTLRFRYP